jgi:hypothetical protein
MRTAGRHWITAVLSDTNFGRLSTESFHARRMLVTEEMGHNRKSSILPGTAEDGWAPLCWNRVWDSSCAKSQQLITPFTYSNTGMISSAEVSEEVQ